MEKHTKITINLPDDVIKYAKTIATNNCGLYQIVLRNMLIKQMTTEKTLKEKNESNRDNDKT